MLPVDALDLEIFQQKERLKQLEAERQHAIDRCIHEWGETEYCPVVIPGYRIEASGQGSDWSPGCYVPEKITKKWKRKCRKCGFEQMTDQIHFETNEVPSFPK